jgi:beta-galactosidase
LGTLWGPSWKDLHIVGFLGDRVVAEQRIPASHEAVTLELTVDDRELVADGTDMTRVLLRHTDSFGNLQPHSRVVVNLEVTGPATLVGPNPCALVGGVTGLYLRVGIKAGTVRLTAHAPALAQTRTATVRIRPAKK